MTLSGTYTVNAPAQTIWDMMMDPEILARLTPAITKLEKIDETVDIEVLKVLQNLRFDEGAIQTVLDLN